MTVTKASEAECNLYRFLKKYDDFTRGELDELAYIRHAKNIVYIKGLIEKVRYEGKADETIVEFVKRVEEIEAALSNSAIKPIPKVWKRASRKAQIDQDTTCFPTISQEDSSVLSKRSKYDNEDELIPKEKREEDITVSEQQRLQEMYSDDLVRMAAILKSSAQQFGDMLKEDAKVMEDADSTLQRNVDKIKGQNSRLSQVLQRTRGNFCLILLSIFNCYCFVCMFIVMRLFRPVKP
ncbi:hypothetical protein BC829DRAFT_382595 [Chytridium lagenaria]|nr:hypothetical protein BC829DRAFT_382595 [Chytridium lagenaria]